MKTKKSDTQKRSTVRAWLQRPETHTMSNREIARLAGVSPSLVSKVRRELQVQADGDSINDTAAALPGAHGKPIKKDSSSDTPSQMIAAMAREAQEIRALIQEIQTSVQGLRHVSTEYQSADHLLRTNWSVNHRARSLARTSDTSDS
ncbi:MAG: hypothetical protein HC837_10050 [Chloroflexaceae bacterium]|nr:hypothetical protein [Chloroflexaceae bacterium]